MQDALFIGSNIYRGSIYGPRHPLSIQRVPAVTDLAHALGWLPADRYRTSPRAKSAALRAFHTDAYLAALQAAEETGAVSDAVRERHGLGTLSNPIFGQMFRRPATAAGGGLLAAELVKNGGVVYNPGGGTHHGFPDRAAGFCFVNEPVLTILRLLDMGLRRVAYVDIDAHHGDGVEAAFAGSQRVRVISLHEARRWPFTGALDDTAGGASFNLPVPRGLNDSEFDLLLNEAILPAVSDFLPDAIYLQAGADALLEDPLSRLALSNNAHVAAVRALRPLAPRLIVSGGGGYNPWSTARAWTAIWGALSGKDLHAPMPLAGRHVLAGLTWHRREMPSQALLTTLIDAPRDGPIRDEIRMISKATQGRLM
ncbi:acetoin utilization protein AcuC [Tropicibacter naphthalenivorans]|uniref:Acetoin utilization protein AcuC n=1 Tax=Tropicibacter naphthalenivorans TaxID=441103 RepID=A0A0P1G6A5_9RHOB|nr:acetoin utilization protein AcuC [Tropicibacter naphthalenivorans]CUH77260.1 Acetoin utilization protein AcuC [Tropicibacter naphthalenivorans]SMC59500.1 acetoin utilization protein AcuC [Tropicibacter naphthalenivorans]